MQSSYRQRQSSYRWLGSLAYRRTSQVAWALVAWCCDGVLFIRYNALFGVFGAVGLVCQIGVCKVGVFAWLKILSAWIGTLRQLEEFAGFEVFRGFLGFKICWVVSLATPSSVLSLSRTE